MLIEILLKLFRTSKFSVNLVAFLRQFLLTHFIRFHFINLLKWHLISIFNIEHSGFFCNRVGVVEWYSRWCMFYFIAATQEKLDLFVSIFLFIYLSLKSGYICTCVCKYICCYQSRMTFFISFHYMVQKGKQFYGSLNLLVILFWFYKEGGKGANFTSASDWMNKKSSSYFPFVSCDKFL